MVTRVYPFAKEGIVLPGGVTYAHGSIELPEHPLDVTLGRDLTEESVIGAASNFLRAPSGLLTCLIEWEADDLPLDEIGVSQWLLVSSDKHRALIEPPYRTIEWLHLSHLFLVPGDTDPWAPIE